MESIPQNTGNFGELKNSTEYSVTHLKNKALLWWDTRYIRKCFWVVLFCCYSSLYRKISPNLIYMLITSAAPPIYSLGSFYCPRYSLTKTYDGSFPLSDTSNLTRNMIVLSL